jgi:predicted Zn-ribbon and HTH transcriptional regulator
MKIELAKLECKRCGWRWAPRTNDVRTCPHCKSAHWDIPKKKVEDTEF